MCRRPEGRRSVMLTVCLHQLSSSRMHGVLRYVFFNWISTGKSTLKIKIFSTYEAVRIGIVYCTYVRNNLYTTNNNTHLVNHKPLNIAFNPINPVENSKLFLHILCIYFHHHHFRQHVVCLRQVHSLFQVCYPQSAI